MSGKMIGLAVALAGFLTLCGVAIAQHGYTGFFELATANWATRTLFADLVVALALVVAWMVRDARERGIRLAPYLIVTLLLGSAGPLLYLIRRESLPAGEIGGGEFVGTH